MTANRLKITLHDEYFNLKAELSSWMGVWWEYNRTGGCGQCSLPVLKNADDYEVLYRPRTSVRISVDGEVRYQGRIVKIERSVKSTGESITAVFYGYLSQLSKVIVRADYEGMELSQIVKDILDNYVLPKTDVTYTPSEISQTDYSVGSLSFNHTAQDALLLLSQLAGNVEWGVDRNRKFYWRTQDRVVRRAFVLGREVNQFSEERSYEGVQNVVNVFGRDGYLTSPQSLSSQRIFGWSEGNRFESSISQSSDGNQLGAVTLSQLSGVQRSVSFGYLTQDEFLERNVPVGALAISKSRVPSLKKYGASTALRTNKYGASTPAYPNKYGNFTQDQLSGVRYQPIGKGLAVQVVLTQQVPSLATQQKRIEYQINDLQRR